MRMTKRQYSEALQAMRDSGLGSVDVKRHTSYNGEWHEFAVLTGDCTVESFARWMQLSKQALGRSFDVRWVGDDRPGWVYFQIERPMTAGEVEEELRSQATSREATA